MSRTEEVVDGIKRMILEGTLRPGDRLPIEKDLAEALGVSPGLVRDGRSALSFRGLLISRQCDGTYVTILDVTWLLAPMEFVVDVHGDLSASHTHAVRRLLECEAARLAGSRISD